MNESDILKSVIESKEKADSAHKRLDEHHAEILSLRESRHRHSGELQSHSGMINGIVSNVGKLESAIDKLAIATEQASQGWQDFKLVAVTGFIVTMFLGSGFIAFCVFVAGELLKWW